jgi:hypothetical protein
VEILKNISFSNKTSFSRFMTLPTKREAMPLENEDHEYKHELLQQK